MSPEICEDFIESPYNHSCEKNKVYSVMYYNNEGESCAGIYSEDELAKLFMQNAIAGSLTFIGKDAAAFEDVIFRERVCDKALANIKEMEA